MNKSILRSLIIWIAASIVGLIAVIFAQLIGFLQNEYFSFFLRYPIAVSLSTPLFFLIAVWLVKRFAPDAKGSGIPQILILLDKADQFSDTSKRWRSPLVSTKTAVIKVFSSAIGILGGASIGREGPTVQISAAVFVLVGDKMRRFAPQIDLRTFLIAGSAAGVAAAFNTPIAGVAFAIEELASGNLGSLKKMVMLAIIISGMAAQGLSGNYLYFGHPATIKSTLPILLGQALLIGIVGGFLGGVFSKILTQPSLTKLPYHWIKRSLATGTICSLLGYFTYGDTSGSGYEVTKKLMDAHSLDQVSLMFPFYKILTTAFSYLSGMAGGIFSPSLSIGAGVGMALAKLFGFANFKACGLFGMVAFFSGAIHAPLTATIIVMEMTDESAFAIPFMISAYVAYGIGQQIMPESLYRDLANKHSEG